jgi:hypothetical protein
MFLAKLKAIGVAAVLLSALGVGTTALWQSVPANEPAAAGRTAAIPAAQAAPAAPTAAAGDKAKLEPPATPPKKEHPFDKPLEALKKPYALPDGEVLKCFRPPFPEERQALFRAAGLPSAAEAMTGYVDLHWRDGRLVFGTLTTGNVQEVRMLLTALAGIYPQEVEGDAQLLATGIGADFVVREGAPADKIVARLQEILDKEFEIPLKLTLREEERKTHVLSGKYKFTATAAGPSEKRLEIYAQELSNPMIGGGGGGTFPEFAQWLGRFIGRRVVIGDVEGAPKTLSWHDNHPDGPFTQQQWDAAHAPEPVLKRIAEQTALTVREETRRVRVLVVESK